MASSYSTWMRHIDDWQWSQVTLIAFEVNPRSGAPDFTIDVTKEGESFLMPCPPMENWQPSEHRDSEFALFLVNPRGQILLGGVYTRTEAALREEVEKCRPLFESLAAADTPPSPPEPMRGPGQATNHNGSTLK